MKLNSIVLKREQFFTISNKRQIFKLKFELYRIIADPISALKIMKKVCHY